LETDFTFIIDDPPTDAYVDIHSKCISMKASLAYKTVYCTSTSKHILIGVIVFPERVFSDCVSGLFTGVELSYLEDCDYVEDWLTGWASDPFVDGPVFHNYIGHPLETIKTDIFRTG